MTDQDETTTLGAAPQRGGQVDPLVMRGIELSGDYFADCNLLVSVIEQDMRAKEEAAKIITEMCQCFGIHLPEETMRRLGA